MTRLDTPDVGWAEEPRLSSAPAAVPSLDPRVLTPPDHEVPTPEGGGGSESGGRPAIGPAAALRPWTSSGFWVLQLAVLALYLIRLAATVAFHLDARSLVLEISTVALFIIPVVFAALNYGLSGALVTTAWITALAVPRFVLSIETHQYTEAWAELMQVALLDVLALVIGQRVSAEREARRLAETSREAHLRAEAMYRDLFDSNQAPILIVDADGFVVETNASAQHAFGGGTVSGDSRPVRLVDMIGPEAAARALTQLLTWRLPTSDAARPSAADPERVEPLPFDVGGELVLFRPTATMLGLGLGDRRMQIIFEDVTAETRRHDLMEAYTARVVLGQEEERRHIAQEIHDGPLQALIHLCRQIDEVEGGSSPAATTDERSPLAGLRTIVEGTVDELRSIARGLRPSILDDLGLVTSINQMLADAGERQRFQTSFGVTGTERRLSPTVELALYRIAQEALSNVERHAAAQRVAVGVDFEAGGLRLLIKDDGVGFAPSAPPGGVRSPSLGLPGMTERAHLIGSRLIIHSDPGVGTTVDVWVPATILDRN